MVENSSSPEPTDSIVIEQNGVGFETLVPERVLPIPENKPGAETPVNFGIRMTNQAQKPMRFCSYHTLSLVLIGANGEHLPFKDNNNASRPINESDCPLVESGEIVTFFLDGKLTWNNNQLYLKGFHKSGGEWGFRDDIKPGRYGFYFRYNSFRQELRVYERGIMKVLENIWTGQVETPVIEISFVLPRS